MCEKLQAYWRKLLVSALVAIFLGLLAGTLALTLDLFFISGQIRPMVVIIASGITALIVDSLFFNTSIPAPTGTGEEATGQEEAQA